MLSEKLGLPVDLLSVEMGADYYTSFQVAILSDAAGQGQDRAVDRVWGRLALSQVDLREGAPTDNGFIPSGRYGVEVRTDDGCADFSRRAWI